MCRYSRYCVDTVDSKYNVYIVYSWCLTTHSTSHMSDNELVMSPYFGTRKWTLFLKALNYLQFAICMHNNKYIMFLGLCGLDHHNFWFQSALELCCATTKMKILQTLLLGQTWQTWHGVDIAIFYVQYSVKKICLFIERNNACIYKCRLPSYVSAHFCLTSQN